ncbi:YgjV family protein [Irregularibacter muris]|uniref:YgjV family protein n=1 Tax=Irregularibacter muris TaxID=1796619 RepID=A0AAE3KYV1_9FIRM|nr:YgjV family protein [Irregularibacter muris]MCR1897631.1 YgjV family protein [Irregularibacter muris]
MTINWLEWIGYLASFLVLVSLLMTSIIRLRWINLIGSGLFSLYGFLIGSFPVAIMNFFTVCINIYYLRRIYFTREDFKILPLEDNRQYYHYFLDFYKIDIEKYTNQKFVQTDKFDVSFFTLRNMIPTGIFLGTRYNETTLEVALDFVIPEYRDLKIGAYIYTNMKDYFLHEGYSELISFSTNKEHDKYFVKMGFEESIEEGKTCFKKTLL